MAENTTIEYSSYLENLKYYADEHRDKNLVYRMSWEEFLALFPPDSPKPTNSVNGILRLQLIYNEISRIEKKISHSSLRTQVLSEVGTAIWNATTNSWNWLREQASNLIQPRQQTL